nr:DUF6500 family protein [Tropicibacter sp. R15_0]
MKAECQQTLESGANQNDAPDLLMEMAQWWIKTHQLDHFEKAIKIRDMIRRGD